jgi:hypothetical protein
MGFDRDSLPMSSLVFRMRVQINMHNVDSRLGVSQKQYGIL